MVVGSHTDLWPTVIPSIMGTDRKCRDRKLNVAYKEVANLISTPNKSATTGFPTHTTGLSLLSVILLSLNWLNRQALDLNRPGYFFFGLRSGTGRNPSADQ